MIKGRFNRGKACKENGFSYLGSTRQSAKLEYSYKAGYETYGIYLAPSTLARDEKHPNINVCPFSAMCAEHCLNGAGRNKIAILANEGKEGLSRIDKARINRTHLFFDNRDLFMKIMLSEINQAMNHAKKNNMGFAIRLNCTSDLNLELFKYEGKNILQMFPNVQFYDYTKVPTNLMLANKYKNYHVVLSYDGTNWDLCEQYLKNGGQVAVVFDLYDNKGKQVMPKTWKGYRVVSGNESDTRFLDPQGVIIGLHYHRVAKDYVKRVYNPRETPFVIRSIS